MPTRLIPYISLLLVAVALSGCARQKIRPKVAEPEGGWEGPTAIDIENFYGSVTVRVEPRTKTVRPVAVVRAPASTDIGRNKRIKNSVSVATSTIEQGGRNVLRVRTSTTWKEPSQVWVNLTVTMPRCDGVRVWNRGGLVKLIGISGGVLVDNGPRFDESGPIELRTNAPMIEPVALITGKGSVIYQVSRGSTGLFELTTGNGRVQFDSPIVHPDTFIAGERRITATLNGGDNQVLLKSGDGEVVVRVWEDAAGYSN